MRYEPYRIIEDDSIDLGWSEISDIEAKHEQEDKELHDLFSRALKHKQLKWYQRWCLKLCFGGVLP